MAHTDRRVAANEERKRSGAYGTHGDRRQKRNKTRAAQKSRAIREYSA